MQRASLKCSAVASREPAREIRKMLSEDEIRTQLQTLAPWTLQDGKLHREYRFADFPTAFGFMAAVATVAERLQHHPEWSNVYGTVRMDLWTHSESGVTARDFELARAAEAVAAKLL